jgi:hypothetical protein
MKQILTIAFVALLGNANAQTADSTLLKMTKVDLSKVYVTEVQRVVKALPMTSLKDVDGNVPKTKYTQAKFSKIAKKVELYNKCLMDEMLEIIPYSDKAELIEAITYLKSL